VLFGKRDNAPSPQEAPPSRELLEECPLTAIDLCPPSAVLLEAPGLQPTDGHLLQAHGKPGQGLLCLAPSQSTFEGHLSPCGLRVTSDFGTESLQET
jgi:hypothetical protein